MLGELFVEHLPHWESGLADVVFGIFRGVFPVAGGPDDQLDGVLGDVEGTDVEGQAGHGLLLICLGLAPADLMGFLFFCRQIGVQFEKRAS